jgi:hypothetical protein
VGIKSRDITLAIKAKPNAKIPQTVASCMNLDQREELLVQDLVTN